MRWREPLAVQTVSTSFQPIQTGTGPFPLESRDLLSERENFEGGVAATAEGHADCNQELGHEFGHELTLLTWRNVVPSDRSSAHATF